MDFRTESRVLGLLALALALFGAFAQYRWHEMPPAVTNTALLVAALCGVWALWLFLPKNRVTTRVRVSSYLIVALILAIGSLGALAGYWLEWRRGPIQWDLDTPLSLSRTNSGPITMGGFQFPGKNTSDHPIPVKSAFVRSNITAQVVPLVIGIDGGELAAADAIVKPEAAFRLWGRYPAPELPVQVSQFLEEFGRFSFVFEYVDGRVFQRNFSASDVEELVSQFDKSSRRRRPAIDGLESGVVRKQ